LSLVVLAGGASSRMGRDKSDLLLNGQTFLENQIQKGILLGVEDILVSGYRGGLCSARIIEDRVPGKGPLGGLEACFRKSRHELCLVLSVDVPAVPVGDLEKLIRKARESSAPAVILQHGARREPLIGVYHTDLADAMMEEITHHRGSVFAFLEKTGYEAYLSDSREEYFLNVNDPVSYECLLAQLQ
jgi:molybdopterin-guanine dinucleotide biosynthesis protein A